MRQQVLTALLLGGLLHSVGSAQTGTSYCNSRFEFCIALPATLYPQGESDAGDGQTFLSRDARVILKVWGNLGQDDAGQDFENAYREASRGWPAGNGRTARVVTYKLFTPSFFVVSGLQDGQVFYQRTVLQASSGNYATSLLSSPEGDKRGGGSAIQLLNKTLKFL